MELQVKKQEKLIKFLIHNVQGMSFGSAQKLLRLGKIKVNGKRIKDNIDVYPNDQILIYNITKSTPTIETLYIDENILIVNKPQGVECATRDKSSENTYSLEELFAKDNAIVVHRLDRLTEGIVILARTKEVAKKFEYYFRNRMIDKYYKALVVGTPKFEGIKTAFLKKNESLGLVDISDSQKEGYKEIITEFNIIDHLKDCSLLNIKLHTGRTHQIRGYFSHIGNPIINDTKYGKAPFPISVDYKGYLLTSYKIKFNLNDEMSYLNNLNIEIIPSWLKYIR